MTHIQRSALLPFPVQQVYELINDVESYPHYMEGCVGSKLLSADEHSMEARLDLAKAGLTFSFTTRNLLEAPHKITMRLVDGPFSRFNGEWLLQPLSDEACKISLKLDFTLKGRVVALAARKLFDPLANNLVDAMVKRAQYLYGSNNGAIGGL